jgi:hypothetical protein
MYSKTKLIFLYLGNGIGSEGAQALAESLKQNTTLTQLNLGGTLMTEIVHMFITFNFKC